MNELAIERCDFKDFFTDSLLNSINKEKNPSKKVIIPWIGFK